MGVTVVCLVFLAIVFIAKTRGQTVFHEAIDINGGRIPIHNTTGCFGEQHYMNCKQSRGRIAPLMYRFTDFSDNAQANQNCTGEA
ncbi:hypothetical protein BaRGS_00024726 [Batillaria attramentaria]|uniref:Secreted protein n=1 Tax=Batillaria attramentaria TaxID=370345 RepID=A0ABD0KA39_9CAEN